MSVGKVAFAVGGGAAIAYGANVFGKIGGTWVNEQAKAWTEKTFVQNPELIGGMAGSVLVASLLKKDTSLLATMILASILLTTLAVKKVNLTALSTINKQSAMNIGKVVFFSGLVALAGAHFIGPGWGTLLGLGAAMHLASQKESIE